MSQKTCGNCGETGHNRRTCQGVPEVPAPAPEAVTEVASPAPDSFMPQWGHQPLPHWIGSDGTRFCYQYEAHGGWVAWPCEFTR